jgi:hypothetical protein
MKDDVCCSESEGLRVYEIVSEVAEGECRVNDDEDCVRIFSLFVLQEVEDEQRRRKKRRNKNGLLTFICIPSLCEVVKERR